jgi:hypothetical protein
MPVSPFQTFVNRARTGVVHQQAAKPSAKLKLACSAFLAAVVSSAWVLAGASPTPTLAASSAYATAVLADAPMAYWRLDEAAGTMMNDASGHGHAGTYTGAVGHSQAGALVGDTDTATGFDGVSAAANAPLDLSSTSRITLEFWLKWASYANDDRLAMELGAPYQATAGVLVDPNSGSFPGKVEVSLGDGTGGAAATTTIARPSAGVWHYYALVLDHATGSITPYVDGAAAPAAVLRQTPQTGSFSSTTLNLMSREGRALFGVGTMDDVAVYPTALSAAQIARHYASGTTTSATPTPSPTSAPSSPATPTPAPTRGSFYGNILWSGDFETGDFSQWGATHQGGSWGNSTAVIESYLTSQGRYAARLEVDEGPQSPQRAEISQTSFAYADASEGKEWYYTFSHYIPTSPNQGNPWNGWTNVMQWMDQYALYTPPLQVSVHASNTSIYATPHYDLVSGIYGKTDFQTYNLGDITYDQWQDFTLHVHWSTDPSQGWFEVWRNGKQVVPRTYRRTLDTGRNYQEAQLYRPQRAGTNVWYFDRVIRHDAYVP